MKFVYAIIIGFVAASMITVVYRFEPNRALARALIALIYITSALAILAKLD
jgi:predicted membrane channel-forming protein YqfA (hemolysin III family)